MPKGRYGQNVVTLIGEGVCFGMENICSEASRESTGAMWISCQS